MIWRQYYTTIHKIMICWHQQIEENRWESARLWSDRAQNMDLASSSGWECVSRERKVSPSECLKESPKHVTADGGYCNPCTGLTVLDVERDKSNPSINPPVSLRVVDVRPFALLPPRRAVIPEHVLTVVWFFLWLVLSSQNGLIVPYISAKLPDCVLTSWMDIQPMVIEHPWYLLYSR